MSLRQTFQILTFRSLGHLEKWLRCRRAFIQGNTIWRGQNQDSSSSSNSWSPLVRLCPPHLGLQFSEWSLFTLWVSGTVIKACSNSLLSCPGSWALVIWSKYLLISPRGRVTTKQLALLPFLGAQLGLVDFSECKDASQIKGTPEPVKPFSSLTALGGTAEERQQLSEFLRSSPNSSTLSSCERFPKGKKARATSFHRELCI